MRTIKMTSISAGPDGVRQIGTTHTVPAAEAAALVHGKHAVYVDSEPIVPPIAQPKRGKK